MNLKSDLFKARAIELQRIIIEYLNKEYSMDVDPFENYLQYIPKEEVDSFSKRITPFIEIIVNCWLITYLGRHPDEYRMSNVELSTKVHIALNIAKVV